MEVSITIIIITECHRKIKNNDILWCLECRCIKTGITLHEKAWFSRFRYELFVNCGCDITYI